MSIRVQFPRQLVLHCNACKQACLVLQASGRRKRVNFQDLADMRRHLRGLSPMNKLGPRGRWTCVACEPQS